MRHRMVIENLSPRTVTSYLNGPKRLIEYWNKHPRLISTDEIFAYLVYEKEVKLHSRSTMRINVNGIRYLYKNFLKRPEIVDEVPYPKQEKYLPEILTGRELKRMFDNIRNTKHRVMLKLIYSCGLRRGEVREIRLTDINRKAMQIHIRQGKGKKDRYVQLSVHQLKELEGYYQTIRPEVYLFNGRKKGDKISEAAMRWALLKALEREKITKNVHLHSLRHSFASHHVSLGTNLLNIQQLLGHETIQTTLLYLHLSDKIGGNQVNPLDVMYGEC
ncbi:MAG: tyrosine-type recombinase/integrase [Bacteroidales bacterium]